MHRLKILHIDDSEEDALLFCRACQAAGLQAIVYKVRNGSEAVSYLDGDGKYADRDRHPLPDLIVAGIENAGNGRLRFSEMAEGANIIPAPASACIHQIYERRG